MQERLGKDQPNRGMTSATISYFAKPRDEEDDSLCLSISEEANKLGCTKSKLLLTKTILCGQVLSLLLCCIGTSSTGLSTWFDIHTPLFQGFFTYLLLAVTCGVALVSHKTQFHEAVRKRGLKYIALALIDVNANYLLIKAYSLTTLTSAQLCDSFTIPTVMVLSFIFLRIRYKLIHYFGVFLCVIGSLTLILTDRTDGDSNAKSELTGDMLAFTGAFLYGCSNVSQEFLVKEFSQLEFLGMLGLCGIVISAIQTVLIERNVVAAIVWNWKIVGLYASFGISQYLWYALMPTVMKISSAAVVNLSLLTADMYTLLVGLLVFCYKFSYFYFIAFCLIMVGLIVYNLKPTPVSEMKLHEVIRTNKLLQEDTIKKSKENERLLKANQNGFRYHSFTCSQNNFENVSVTHTVAL